MSADTPEPPSPQAVTPSMTPGSETAENPGAVKAVTTPASQGPTMGLKEAARVSTVSLSTLRRRRGDLLAAGATVTDSRWEIPISALVHLGLLPRVTPPDQGFDTDQETSDTRGAPPSDTSATVAEVAELRAQLEASERRAGEAEKRAAVAEAIAAERDRIIAAQSQTLRMLEARPAPEPAPRPPGPTGPPPNHPPPRRDWFRN